MLEEIFVILRDDAYLAARLSTYAAIPAIFAIEPPSDIGGYHLRLWMFGAANTKAEPRCAEGEQAQIYIDILSDRETSIIGTNEISNRIFDLFSRRELDTADYGGYTTNGGESMFVDSKGLLSRRRIVNLFFWPK
jgi:hypothetical protein